MIRLGPTVATSVLHCLNCKRPNDYATGIDNEGQPSPGDVMICLHCGHIMLFTADRSMREPTDAERIEIAADKRITEMVMARKSLFK